VNQFDNIKTRADMERPVSEGGFSMGAGRQIKVPGCDSDKSPDGEHLYIAVSNVQSVEHFVCEYCGGEFYD
jgi:hypothetical protein